MLIVRRKNKMSAEEKKPEGEKKAELPKLWWIVIAIVIIAIVIGVVAWVVTRPPPEKVPPEERPTKWIITPVTRTKTETIRGFTSAGETTPKTIRIPKYVEEVKITLVPGEDESGRLFGESGGPGDDLFSIKVTTPTGEEEEWRTRGTPASRTFKINNPPKGKAIEPVEAFEREIATTVGRLYPKESWPAEIGVSAPLMDPEDPGNSWTIEVEYTYWEPKWVKAE
jgi:hypothetical protein